MIKFEELLRGFSLSESSRQNIINGSNETPAEFVAIAQTALSGHFCVKRKGENVVARPTRVEFFCHEEAEHGIKDYIVYHRNTRDSLKFAFELGTLHHHVSGVDIVFEKGDVPDTAIRASMLVREFEVEGKDDDRSTMLYEALCQQSSIFDGIPVQWIDGTETVGVTADVRKNVAQFEANGEKKTTSDYLEFLATEDKKYVQDLRKWQFHRKQVMDSDTNLVYISSWIKEECPDFYGRFTEPLAVNNTAYYVMQTTSIIPTTSKK